MRRSKLIRQLDQQGCHLLECNHLTHEPYLRLVNQRRYSDIIILISHVSDKSAGILAFWSYVAISISSDKQAIQQACGTKGMRCRSSHV